MRPDQRARLEALTERLADAFLLEADPAEWPGDGQSPADMDQQARGDRYWCKKNAMATGGVLRFALDLQEKHGGTASGDEEEDADMDKRIRDAERRAAAATQRVIDKVGKIKAPAKARADGKG